MFLIQLYMFPLNILEAGVILDDAEALAFSEDEQCRITESSDLFEKEFLDIEIIIIDIDTKGQKFIILFGLTALGNKSFLVRWL